MKVLYIGTNPVSKHNLRELLAALPGNFEVDLLVRLEEGEIEGRWRPLDPASGGHYWESTIPYVHLAYHEEVVDIELTVVTWQCRDDQRELTSLPGGLWAFRIERRFKYDSLDVRATLLEPVLDQAEEELKSKIRGKTHFCLSSAHDSETGIPRQEFLDWLRCQLTKLASTNYVYHGPGRFYPAPGPTPFNR